METTEKLVAAPRYIVRAAGSGLWVVWDRTMGAVVDRATYRDGTTADREAERLNGTEGEELDRLGIEVKTEDGRVYLYLPDPMGLSPAVTLELAARLKSAAEGVIRSAGPCVMCNGTGLFSDRALTCRRCGGSGTA